MLLLKYFTPLNNMSSMGNGALYQYEIHPRMFGTYKEASVYGVPVIERMCLFLDELFSVHHRG